MSMRIRCLYGALGIAVFFLTLSILSPAVHAADPPDEVAQIRTASNRYLEALNSGDADRIVAFWTPQGTFVDADNISYQARKKAREEFPEDAVSQQQTTVVEHQCTIRLITPEVALEQGSASVDKTNESAASAETSHIAVWVKMDERWLLDYLKEFRVPSGPMEGRLAELEWMVGQWESHSDGIDARLTVTWSDQRQFLIQRFTVQLPDQDELRGEQRIGWDASNEQIRSWLFRSDGGFAEGVWSLQGDAWVVKKTETTPDGEKAATVNLWVNEDPGSCWFKSLNGRVGDQPLADLILQFRRTDSP